MTKSKKTKKQGYSNRQMRSYMFPDTPVGPLSVEAESTEEAEKKLEKELKSHSN